MFAWIIIMGALTVGAVINAIDGIVNRDTALLVGGIILGIIFAFLFFVLLKKYHSPAYKEKQERLQEQRKEWESNAPERERLRREEKARKQENKRLHTTIVATRLIGEGSAEYKKSVGSVMMRGAVGGFFAGAAGATLGMATAKNKNTNKNVRRFLVKYLDGHIEEKEATIGSSDYEIYMAHLEWED